MSTIEKALKKNKESQRNKTKEANAQEIQSDSVSSQDNNAASPTVDGQEALLAKSVQSTPAHNNSQEVFIDLDKMESEGFVSINSTRTVINEEYRAIKRKLLTNAFGPIADTLTNSNIIMVSSARCSEGKTFTAINLALSIAAEKDKTVLLVDADVLKPKVAKTLGVEYEDGLMEYLLDEKHDISEVMYRTNIEKLRLIPAGRSHHLSSELLASRKMQETIDEIASRYPDRIVIIDTPPLIGINETAILTNFAGQAIVVCVEGKSRINDLNKATSLLNPDMAIGFVVNKAIVSVSDDTSYYGYYYAK